MGRKLIRKVGVIWIALLTTLLCALSASAAVPAGLDRNLGLRIQCTPNGDPVNGMRFQFYYIASVSADGEVTVVEPFTESGVTAQMLTSSASRTETMSLLAEFINGGGATGDYESTVTSNGIATVRNLAEGIYLCASNTRYVLDGGQGDAYTPVPFLFRMNAELVASQTQAGEDAVAVTKFSVSSGGGGGRTTPTDPVSPDPDPGETLPPDDGDDGGDRSTPDEPANPSPTEDTAPTENPVEEPEITIDIDEEEVPLAAPIIEEIEDEPVPLSAAPLLPDPEPDEDELLMELADEEVPLARLPQTGLLWWPVPLMAVCGLVLFLTGWKKSRERV